MRGIYCENPYMVSKKIYLTKEGLEELRKEYTDLAKVKRPQTVQRLTDARNQGDLSENAEYVAAREELAFIDGRVDELEEILKKVDIISDTTKSGTAVKLGSEVTVKIDGKSEVYRVVGEWEADPTEKKISHESPLGKALIGKKIGEKIHVDAPAGKIAYTIVQIK
jgi:transcription elongation factor GreA